MRSPETVTIAQDLMLRGDRRSGYELIHREPSGALTVHRFTDVREAWKAVDQIDAGVPFSMLAAAA